MTVSKYRVPSTCLSCGRRVSEPVVVVTTAREDDHQSRAITFRSTNRPGRVVYSLIVRQHLPEPLDVFR